MEFNDENNKKIINFLRNLANNIENKTIDDKLLQHIGEFYMSVLFKEEIDKVDSSIEEKDLVKFLTVGWYIYNIILKEKEISNNEIRSDNKSK